MAGAEVDSSVFGPILCTILCTFSARCHRLAATFGAVIVFWVVVALIAIAYAVGAFTGFFTTFEAANWTTLIGATAAFALSLFAVVRGRTHGAHFEVVRDIREQGRTVLVIDGEGPARHELRKHWMVSILQKGPADAEQISARVRSKGGKWANADLMHADGVKPRGYEFYVLLPQEPDVDIYDVRLEWSQLPNTLRRHRKSLRANVAQARIDAAQRITLREAMERERGESEEPAE